MADYVPLLVAGIALVAAGVTAAMALIGTLRKSKDERELGIIHESQDSLLSLVATQRTEILDLRTQVIEQRAEIVDLRNQVAGMRVELQSALRNHDECEKARDVQAAENRRLRAELDEERNKP